MPKIVCTRSLGDAVGESRCTVIVIDHLEYRGLAARYMGELMSKPCAVVDARHIVDPKEAFVEKIVFRGFGKPRLSSCPDKVLQMFLEICETLLSQELDLILLEGVHDPSEGFTLNCYRLFLIVLVI